MLRSSLALPPVALAARAGDPLPGALDGARLRDFRFHGLPDGTVLIQSMLDDVESPGDGSTPHALLRWRPASGLETFERAGEPSAFAGGGRDARRDR